MENNSKYNISCISAKCFLEQLYLTVSVVLKSDLSYKISNDGKNNNEAAIYMLFVSQFIQSSADTKMWGAWELIIFFKSCCSMAGWQISGNTNEMKQTKQLQSARTKLIDRKHYTVLFS